MVDIEDLSNLSVSHISEKLSISGGRDFPTLLASISDRPRLHTSLNSPMYQ